MLRMNGAAAARTGVQRYARDVAMMHEMPAPNSPPAIQQRIGAHRLGEHLGSDDGPNGPDPFCTGGGGDGLFPTG